MKTSSPIVCLFLTGITLSLPPTSRGADENSVSQLSVAERSALLQANNIKETSAPPSAPGEMPQLPERVLCESVKYADGSARLVWRDYTRKEIVSQFYGTDKKLISEKLATTAHLSVIERELALYLVRKQSTELKAVFGAQVPDASPFEELVPLVGERSDPLFGHRLVRFRFRKAKDANKADYVLVIVDLDAKKLVESSQSEGTIEKDPQTGGGGGAPSAPGEVAQEDPPQEQTVVQDFAVEFRRNETETITTRTAWKIKFGVESHNGGSKVLCIKEAHYSRRFVKDDNDANDGWLQILGDTRLAEINVPYNDGDTEFYDISNFSFGLQKLDERFDAGPSCVGPAPKVFFECVMKEVHDAHTYSMDRGGRAIRGQQMDLWSVLAAANYSYIMRYSFHADGMVELNLGPTSHNLAFGSKQRDDITTHLHVGCWRITPVLGDASALKLQEVKYISTPATGARSRTEVVDFNGGREGGVEIVPHEYTGIRIESRTQNSPHDPPSKISYDLIPHGFGAARRFAFGSEWTQSDFWATLPRTQTGEPALEFKEVNELAKDRRALNGSPFILWHHSSLIHRARDEDFGPTGANPSDGVASANYAGLILKPRNLHGSSPFYKP